LPQILSLLVPLYKYVELVENIEISKAEASKDIDSDDEDFYHRVSDPDFLKDFLKDDLSKKDLQAAEKLGQQSIFGALQAGGQQNIEENKEQDNAQGNEEDEDEEETAAEFAMKFTSEVFNSSIRLIMTFRIFQIKH